VIYDSYINVKSSYSNDILLNAIPHPALLIRSNRVIIAANDLALKSGAFIGGLCWKEYKHCKFLSDKDKSTINTNGYDYHNVLSCDFCKADIALENNKSIKIEKKIDDTFWEIYWVPANEDDVYLHYAIDITELRKTQIKLEESNRRFKQLSEVSFEGICIHNNGIILDCNKRMETIFGYKMKELIGMSLLKLISLETNNKYNLNSNLIFSGRQVGIKKMELLLI